MHITQIVMSLLVMVSVNQVTLSKPLQNGFSLKFKPYSSREDVKPKTFSSLFTKVSKDSDADLTGDLVTKAYNAQNNLGAASCGNQIAKILFPVMGPNENISQLGYINIPVIQQPFKDYKIIVATAPSNIKIAGPEAEPVVVYIVFPEEDPSDSRNMNVPTVYFVTKSKFSRKTKKQEHVDPIIIIDSNRTVTGLKSTEVAKYVRFKKQRSKIVSNVNQSI